jgi:hypothetical protein
LVQEQARMLQRQPFLKLNRAQPSSSLGVITPDILMDFGFAEALRDPKMVVNVILERFSSAWCDGLWSIDPNLCKRNASCADGCNEQ